MENFEEQLEFIHNAMGLKAIHSIHVEARIEEIRKTLSGFVEYDKAALLRKELKDIADRTYVQKYTDTEQIDFLNRHPVMMKEVHAQSTNFPYYLEMFTVLTRNIYADNVRQLLDKGIDYERNKNF
jgi:hypothetical protein